MSYSQVTIRRRTKADELTDADIASALKAAKAADKHITQPGVAGGCVFIVNATKMRVYDTKHGRVVEVVGPIKEASVQVPISLDNYEEVPVDAESPEE